MAKTPSATHPSVTLTADQWQALLKVLDNGSRLLSITAAQQGHSKKESGELLIKAEEIEESIKQQLPQQ